MVGLAKRDTDQAQFCTLPTSKMWREIAKTRDWWRCRATRQNDEQR